MEIRGKTAIITGSGSGIGRALALQFARNGANVVTCGRRKERLEETVELVEKEDGVAIAVTTDITQRDQVQRLAKTTLESFGAIDILFNNAGSFRSLGGMHEIEPDLWWHDITVNLLGPGLCIREILPHMLDRDEGVIINMDGGRPPGGTGYACGKAGLMEITRILVKELEMLNSRVMVFGAGPGLVRTEMTEYQAEEEAGRRWIPSTAEKLASGNTRQPEDIARATIEMLRIARPEMNGISFNPGTDFVELRKKYE